MSRSRRDARRDRGDDRAAGRARAGRVPPRSRQRRHRPRADSGSRPVSHRRLLVFILALAGVLAALAAGVRYWRNLPLPVFPRPVAEADAGPVFEDFAGTASCAECHPVEHAAWRESTHGMAGGTPREIAPIMPFDARPIRFADADVLPRRTAGAGLRFEMQRPGVRDVAFDVAGLVGGGHMFGGGTQGYLTRHEDGTVRLLPWEQTADGVWFCNTSTRAERGWQPITPDMHLADCGDWPPRRVLGQHDRLANCQECHGSQIETRVLEDGARLTRWQSLSIDCESCHGPLRGHVDDVREGTTPASLLTSSKEASVRLCLRCHGLKDALEPGYLAGRDLEAHYSLGLPIVSEDALWPDGRTRTFAYQEGHLYSACYLNGGMTCVDCHAPHGQDYRDFHGEPLPGRFDDGQCLGCHPSKAADPPAHTRHAADSPGSRCVACHMPFIQQPDVGGAVDYARSDHTISIPRPSLDSVFGLRGACAACHVDQSATALARIVEEWHAPLKPLPAAVAALISPAPPRDVAGLLDDAASHPAATLALLGRLLRRSAIDAEQVDAPARDALLRAARSEDTDIAAAALTLLHVAHGTDRATRRNLIATFSAHPQPERVRTRWVALLGWLADTLVQDGRADRGVELYEMALELRPGDAAVLRNLGYARLRLGQAQPALDAFRLATSAAPDDPLAHIGVGIALSALGAELGAAEAYRTALRADPHEPLAHLNLGNVALRAGRYTDAAASYERALELDPALASAHFNLARTRLALGDDPAAAAALRQGLAFEPDNSSAADMLEQLEAAGHTR